MVYFYFRFHSHGSVAFLDLSDVPRIDLNPLTQWQSDAGVTYQWHGTAVLHASATPVRTRGGPARTGREWRDPGQALLGHSGKVGVSAMPHCMVNDGLDKVVESFGKGNPRQWEGNVNVGYMLELLRQDNA